jgi:hypothetical protein
MTDTNYPLSADADLDDLPRTLRREHEARAREARERQRGEAGKGDLSGYAPRDDAYEGAQFLDEPPAATVTRIDVPFMRLVFFFLKAVVAAIPALILLTAILWAGGQLVETFYPDIIKMKILISFPG